MVNHLILDLGWVHQTFFTLGNPFYLLIMHLYGKGKFTIKQILVQLGNLILVLQQIHETH
jgi:hypothetical protein